jgi:putative FmdB family regulatory protein
MPIYEYECLNCEKRFEVIQKFSDEPLKSCPDCNGQIRKCISNTSFVLKGSGWYITDYASPERKKAMEAEKGSSENKTSKNTESKKESVAAS